MKTEITLQRSKGDKVVKLTVMGAVDLPCPVSEVKYSSVRKGTGGYEGHTAHNIPHHLTTWTLPKNVEEIRERVERALEEGIPDQKRSMLRNQDDGMLNDDFVDEIAMGLDVENPFQRWNMAAADTCRVAVCIDANVISWQKKENYQSKVALAAGVAFALEALDYEVMVISGVVSYEGHGTSWGSSKPRTSAEPKVIVRALKAEDEPVTASNFAAMSDTGIARLMQVWGTDGNCHCTTLTNREWRELTDSDLFIHIADPDGYQNSDGIPQGAHVGLKGDDVLTLSMNRFKDMDKAVTTIEKFFHEQEE